MLRSGPIRKVGGGGAVHFRSDIRKVGGGGGGGQSTSGPIYESGGRGGGQFASGPIRKVGEEGGGAVRFRSDTFV